MLLSMLTSFLLARKFSGKTRELSAIVGTFSISALSVILLRFGALTFPLSFPFCVNRYPTNELYFLGFDTGYPLHIIYPYSLAVSIAEAIFLFLVFFLPINSVGTIIGYWIEKTTVFERWFHPHGTFVFTLVAILIISTTYLALPPKLKYFYTLNDAYFAEEHPRQVLVNNSWILACPNCGAELTGISMLEGVICGFEVVYYCKQENIFWVVTGAAGGSRWYGPYTRYVRQTNALAICGIVFSVTALVLSVLRRKSLSK